MAEITVGSKTLTIPSARTEECAAIIKVWASLDGDTPSEILDAWSVHVIEEVERVLIDRIGDAAYEDSMEGSASEADAAKVAAEAQADSDLVIS